MTPIERAALILWQMDQQSQPTTAAMVPPDISDWRAYIPKARAVFQAIREPSEAQLASDPTTLTGTIYPEDLWRAMIDAALEEG